MRVKMRNHHIMRTLALALALLLVSSFLVATAQTSYQTEYKSTFSGNITSMNPYTTEALSDYMFIANLIDGWWRPTSTAVRFLPGLVLGEQRGQVCVDLQTAA